MATAVSKRRIKIIIVGAGIAGLATYLSLHAHLSQAQADVEVRIYESHDIGAYLPSTTSDRTSTPVVYGSSIAADETFSPQSIGLGVGIARNGLAVLSRLPGGEGMIDAMLRRGHRIEAWNVRAARGWGLVRARMARRDEGEERVSAVMIGRLEMWRILLERVIEVAGRDVVGRGRVVDVQETERGMSVVFHDGRVEDADLVVGADGLRSQVRAWMFGRGKTIGDGSAETGTAVDGVSGGGWGLMRWLTSWFGGPAPTKRPDYVTPRYEGLVGVGAYIPSSLLREAGHEPGDMTLCFGPNGFFGSGYITTKDEPDDGEVLTLASANACAEPGPHAVFWSTFSSVDCENPFPLVRELSGGKAKPGPYDFDRRAAVEALLKRHEHWKDPAAQAVVAYFRQILEDDAGDGVSLEKAGLGFYPTWTAPRLPKWWKSVSGGGSVVLVGDSAHAMQPSSGQGACQALEDAEALGLCLGHSLAESPEADTGVSVAERVHQALKVYQSVRMPRVDEIYTRSQRMSRTKVEMGIVVEMLMYGFVKILGLFHDGYFDRLLDYDLVEDVSRAWQVKQG
jgi:2-polyprenyl-6-methoxyphenol hydroxylase-like FAD-dependent oxidoreductase